ncbi:hypothetical protein C0J52_20451 [Blattella germanica]|nr:hypothetical protein C0J52_20451 [Blattella germanica]
MPTCSALGSTDSRIRLVMLFEERLELTGLMIKRAVTPVAVGWYPCKFSCGLPDVASCRASGRGGSEWVLAGVSIYPQRMFWMQLSLPLEPFSECILTP